jgi:dihydrofolate synthase/folylpolyglutamate synthase
MDHQDRLGDTLEKIAREKIAIFRPKTPIFCGLQDPKVANLVHQAADDLGAPVSMFGVDFSSEYSLTNMVWQDLKTGDTLTLPAPPLKGAHQIHNAALAVACVRGLESVLPVAHEALIQGITQTFWPARLQSVSPVVFGLPESWSVYVDGSHNAAGAETLRVFLNAQLWQRRILVMGCLARKDWKSIVDTLASWPTEIHLVPVTGHETSWDLGEVAGYLQTKGHDVTTHFDWRAALAVANKDNVSLPTGLIITGSLYLAGEVLKDTRGV